MSSDKHTPPSSQTAIDATPALPATADPAAPTAQQTRDAFLAAVSHELRGPLNGIQTWAHILERHLSASDQTPLIQRAIDGIRTGINQQVRLIEDLLDATRIPNGQVQLNRQVFALRAVVNEALSSVQGMATGKRIALHCDCRLQDEKIEGDPDRIRQILWNLLSNAIKFTPANGNVWLSADSSAGQARITVRDDGMGIAPDSLPHLYDRFNQQDGFAARNHSGLGLGLFLARHLLQLHGGSIQAESPGANSGASFTVLLPLYPGQE